MVTFTSGATAALACPCGWAAAHAGNQRKPASRRAAAMIFRSPFPDVAIPEMTLTQYVLQQAERQPSKPALIDGNTGQSITYGQFATLVRRLAVGLAGRGFGKGDVLAIYSPNLPEYAV